MPVLAMEMRDYGMYGLLVGNEIRPAQVEKYRSCGKIKRLIPVTLVITHT